MSDERRLAHVERIPICWGDMDDKRPITYPGTVEVRLLAGAPGGSSVPTYYELRVDADPLPYADGAAVVVFIDMTSQKPVRIPENLRDRLSAP